jgi:hypothetical protein
MASLPTLRDGIALNHFTVAADIERATAPHQARLTQSSSASAARQVTRFSPHGTLVGWSPCDCTPGVHGHRRRPVRFIRLGRFLSMSAIYER